MYMPKNQKNQKPMTPPQVAAAQAFVRKFPIPPLEQSLARIKATCHEHLDDFVILARRRGAPDQSVGLAWAFSDNTWARGAMSRVLQELECSDQANILDREDPA